MSAQFSWFFWFPCFIWRRATKIVFSNFDQIGGLVQMILSILTTDWALDEHSSIPIYCPGWGPIRKWPLIRPSPTHTVCSQTKITVSGIWFERAIVWSESEDGMIKGHSRVVMVWSEVISVWVGLIKNGFKRTLAWLEKILRAIGSDQRPFRKDYFSFNLLSFYQDVGSANRQQKAAFWSQAHLEFDGFDQNQKLIKMTVPLKRNFD